MRLIRCRFSPLAAIAAMVGASACTPDQAPPATPSQQPSSAEIRSYGVENRQAEATATEPVGVNSRATGPVEAAGTLPNTAPITGPQSDSQQTGGEQSDASLGTMSDPQLVAIVTELNDQSTRLAQYGESNAQGAEVKRFAHDMVTSRLDMQDKLSSVIAREHLTPAPDPWSDRLAGPFRSSLALLQVARGTGFDRAYLEVELRRQATEIEQIDQIVLRVHDAAIGETLTSIRTRIEAHVHMAHLLQRTAGAQP